jgi:T-complex protein 1 subunit theta
LHTLGHPWLSCAASTCGGGVARLVPCHLARVDRPLGRRTGGDELAAPLSLLLSLLSAAPTCFSLLLPCAQLVKFTPPPTVFHDAEALAKCITPVIAAKQWGNEELFAARIAEACVLAMPASPGAFNVDNVRVAKIPGNSILGTTVVRGMCMTRGAVGTIVEVHDAKVAVYGIPLDSVTTETKGTVLLKSAEELRAYNDSEEAALEKVIKSIADTGCNLLICGQAIGELALHFLEKYKIMCMKCPSKFELRRICRTTGANTLVRLEPPAPADMGACKHVYVKEIGSTRCTLFDHESAESRVATIVVRGSTVNIMDDVERAIDDGVNVVKSMTKDARFVPGAGATELLLADAITTFGEAQPGAAARCPADAAQLTHRTAGRWQR